VEAEPIATLFVGSGVGLYIKNDTGKIEKVFVVFLFGC
jgi:hypothetical protein